MAYEIRNMREAYYYFICFEPIIKESIEIVKERISDIENIIQYSFIKQNREDKKAVLIGCLTIEPKINEYVNHMLKSAGVMMVVDRGLPLDVLDSQNAVLIDCSAYNKMADYVEQFFHKGSKIIVSGYFSHGSHLNDEGIRIFTKKLFIEEQKLVENMVKSEQDELYLDWCSKNNPDYSLIPVNTSIKKQSGIFKKKNNCIFCEKSNVIDYKDTDSLKNYISEEGIVLPRKTTQICKEHQRELKTAIKTARNLALLPSVKKLKPAEEYIIGCSYVAGIDGYEKDLSLAAFYFENAAKRGYVLAQCEIGECYTYGFGVDRDRPKGMQWYRKAAKKGNAKALYEIGFCYDYGIGVVKDANKAAHWYQKAGKKGYFIEKMAILADTIVKIADSKEKKHIAQKICETIEKCNPISTKKTIDAEIKILDKMVELSKITDNIDSQEFLNKTAEILNMIEVRNEKQ